MTFEMHYGALWDIKEQLETQGVELNSSDLQIADKAHFALNYLHIHSFITETDYTRGTTKLHKWILKRIQKK